MLTHISLFSGIGGLDLAAERAGFRTIGFVEVNRRCQRVLRKNWPGVPIVSDVREVAAIRRWGTPTLVSAGFPCQPHTVAGKRQASGDSRNLWPETVDVLRALRPGWFVGENVPGLSTSEFGQFFGSLLGDLAALGYSVGWGHWTAADVGAPQPRERIFILAYAAGARSAAGFSGPQPGETRHAGVADNNRLQIRRPQSWGVEPPLARVADGIPQRVDRIKALGNAVCPEQAYPLFQAVADYEALKCKSIRMT